MIDGNSVAIERHGVGNCMVNLTMMAKPFGPGKKPANWLRLDTTKEYLEVAKRLVFSQVSDVRTAPELIIVRNGGADNEHGTWCTDYRIAMRFAQWLSSEFAWKVDELLVRIANGERIVSETGFFSLGGKQWVGCTEYCSTFGKSIHSFYGLLGNYPKEFAFWGGVWYMSRDLFNMKDVQSRYESRRTAMRTNNDRHQLAIPFVELNTKED